ncbi:mediator of RNA polymerase II transcription subunit 1-domain-containing protein [Aspergillus ambiguus]|uniref:RNA polymerase II mediator complex middle subunit MED1 n=1 Tax=Aspergillus ambiguus TaxID=176160 RepID=UPI003CCE4CAA
MATPSSRPNPAATPTHMTSSPRPSGPIPRPNAHKSPSTKTPSASGPGHAPQPPSTHQYATPLAATTGADDQVSFSSPSALLALGGYGGISPSPAVHDGLVATGMNESDIQALGMHGLKLGNARDSDEERRRHIDEVVQLLGARVAGRGVCREGIERLSQLEGFESIWQEDSLNIAGNFVDLEIDFYRGQNIVKDVSLKYDTPEAANGERREEATAVLRHDLVQTPEEGERGSWKSLAGFHENLQWLARHDRLSQEVNCFEAIEGLYESLKSVWEEEKKHCKVSGVYEQLSSGWVGRPGLHQGGRIGLSLDYWVHQARVLDAKRKTSPDEMVLDQPAAASQVDDEPVRRNGGWSVVVECEEGYPSLRVSKEWVNTEVITVVNNAGDEPASAADPSASGVTMVNWAEPPPTLASGSQGQPDAMALDSGMLGSSPPNRRFVARLEPPLDVPILAASDIYRHLGIQMPQEFKVVTYDGLLAPGWSPLSAAGAMGLGPDEVSQIGRRRRHLEVEAVGKGGKPYTKNHSYTFQPFESVAGRTIRDIPFAHPRQLADILPTLRQYAFLANLIRNVFGSPATDVDPKKDVTTAALTAGNQTGSLEQTWKSAKSDTIILSNDDPAEKKLNWLLGGNNDAGDHLFRGVDESTSNGDVKVDVTLRTQIGQAPVIMLLFTADDLTSDGSSPSNDGDAMFRKVSLSLEIGLNGRVSVLDMSGLLDGDMDTPAMQGAGGQKNEVTDLQSKIARVLEISQDIGTLVEWILRWAQQRNGR